VVRVDSGQPRQQSAVTARVYEKVGFGRVATACIAQRGMTVEPAW
jgi:hypothetical protein